jgi:hypothetical protein
MKAYTVTAKKEDNEINRSLITKEEVSDYIQQLKDNCCIDIEIKTWKVRKVYEVRVELIAIFRLHYDFKTKTVNNCQDLILDEDGTIDGADTPWFYNTFYSKKQAINYLKTLALSDTSSAFKIGLYEDLVEVKTGIQRWSSKELLTTYMIDARNEHEYKQMKKDLNKII